MWGGIDGEKAVKEVQVDWCDVPERQSSLRWVGNLQKPTLQLSCCISVLHNIQFNSPSKNPHDWPLSKPGGLRGERAVAYHTSSMRNSTHTRSNYIQKAAKKSGEFQYIRFISTLCTRWLIEHQFQCWIVSINCSTISSSNIVWRFPIRQLASHPKQQQRRPEMSDIVLIEMKKKIHKKMSQVKPEK